MPLSHKQPKTSMQSSKLPTILVYISMEINLWKVTLLQKKIAILKTFITSMILSISLVIRDACAAIPTDIIIAMVISMIVLNMTAKTGILLCPNVNKFYWLSWLYKFCKASLWCNTCPWQVATPQVPIFLIPIISLWQASSNCQDFMIVQKNPSNNLTHPYL